MRVSFPEHHLFQLLRRFENQYLPLDLFLSQYFRANKALGSKDRQLINSAVFGMTRWKNLIDHLVGQNPTWENRYSVFRSFQPSNYLSVNNIPLHIRLGCPQELFTLLLKSYGEKKTIEICQACNTEAPVTVRINPLKTTREQLLNLWKPEFQVIPTSRSPWGIHFTKRTPLFATPEFKEGLFEIQDEASQLVASLVQAKPAEHVLDYCAGAGGKTLAFAHTLNNQGQIYLHDVRPHILEQARKRLKRAGIQNIQLLPEGHTGLDNLKKKMDWVLVDAPCSGTGTYRRHPDQKWRFSKETLDHLLDQQKTIFEKSLSYLKPGGKIIYATCSVLQEENQQQIAHFIKKYNLKLCKEPFVSLPAIGAMDGFFAATLTAV